MATFETLAAKCAAGVALDLLVAIASVESGVHPLAVRDGAVLTRVASAGEGVAIAVGAADQGREVRIGLMGLSEQQIRAGGLTLAEGFDPCASLIAAAGMIEASRGTVRGQNADTTDRVAIRAWWRPDGRFASIAAFEAAIARERGSATVNAKREMPPTAAKQPAKSNSVETANGTPAPSRRSTPAEPGVLEVLSNEAGQVWIETTAGWTEREVPELTDARAQNLARAVATLTHQHSGRERPILSATLPEGERVQFVLPPAVEDGHVSVTIRKPSAATYSLDELDQGGLFADVRRQSRLAEDDRRLSELLRDGDISRFLGEAVCARKNIIISGATGSGKTTLSKALIAEIPIDQRIITIEDTPELVVPHRNRIALRYSKDGQGLPRPAPRNCLKPASGCGLIAFCSRSCATGPPSPTCATSTPATPDPSRRCMPTAARWPSSS